MSKANKTLEWAVENNGAQPYEETVLSHTNIHKNTVEARVIIVWRDKDGNEWEHNDCRKFRLKRLRPATSVNVAKGRH